MVKVKCDNCNYGPCKLTVQGIHKFSGVPHACPYTASDRYSRWLLDEQPPNKVVEDGQAGQCVFSGNCDRQELAGCSTDCDDFPPAT